MVMVCESGFLIGSAYFDNVVRFRCLVSQNENCSWAFRGAIILHDPSRENLNMATAAASSTYTLINWRRACFVLFAPELCKGEEENLLICCHPWCGLLECFQYMFACFSPICCFLYLQPFLHVVLNCVLFPKNVNVPGLSFFNL